jgi:hypothetical protein
MPEPTDEQLAAALRARRPEPPKRFGTGLRERLLQQEMRERRPQRLWRLVAAYGGSGLLLLLLAAIGAGGGGPFG